MRLIDGHLDGFARSRRGEGRKASGTRRYCDRLKLFDRWLEGQGVSDLRAIEQLTMADYRDHLAERCMPATVLNARAAISAFAQWAILHKHMDVDPTLGIKWPRRERGAPKPLTEAELARLWRIVAVPCEDDYADWQRRRNRLICCLMYYAGLRLGEAGRLRVGDVNLTAAMLTIRASKSRDRSVAMHDDLIEEVLPWLAGRKLQDPLVQGGRLGAPMKPGAVAHVFERWLPARGLRVNAHRLRHSFGTELLRASGNLGLVQEAMGHASPETTRIYTQIVVEDQRPAIHRLPSLKRFDPPADAPDAPDAAAD